MTIRLKTIKILSVVILVIVAAAFIAMEFMKPKSNFASAKPLSTTFVETGISVNYDVESKSSVYTYSTGDGFFCASKDGIKYIASNGLEKMNHSYSMFNPIVIGEGGIVAVGEKGGTMIYVYNANGNMYTVQTEMPILAFSINTIGYIGIITQNKDKYSLYVYNNSGLLVTDGEHTDANIIPVSCDISNDGRILAISYLDVNDAQMNSSIFYTYVNKSESTQTNAKDGIYAWNQKNENQMIGMIKFMDDNKLIAVSDAKIFCVDADKKAAILWSMELNNKISAINFGESGWFAVAYGEGILNKESVELGTVITYDLSGQPLGEYKAGKKITSLVCAYNSVISHYENDYTAISKKGSVLWKYTAISNISELLFLGGTNQVLSFSSTKASIMNLSKGKEPDTPITIPTENSETPIQDETQNDTQNNVESEAQNETQNENQE